MIGPKIIEIVAGPNGSGKSTFAETFFLKQKKIPTFINSDTIASGISPLDVEQASFQAGRIMLSTIKSCIEQNKHFAFESTLSGKTWLSILKNAQRSGYEIVIYFIFLNRVQDNLKRIKTRVKMGGHNVPKETVMRRFPKCFTNFWFLYRPLSTNWFIFDNSGSKPKLLTSKTSFGALNNHDKKKFEATFLRKI